MEVGRDQFDRIIGEVFVKASNSEEKYLNGEQVRSGLAYEYKQYSKSCLNRDAITTIDSASRSGCKFVSICNDDQKCNANSRYLTLLAALDNR